ncbi:MAG: HEAT repeat domain-containing protein [Candidatus Thiodiazotropha sp. DIVDIV]
MPHREAPDVLFLLATGCHHCPVVLERLTQLLKEGRIGRLESVNIMNRPDIARELNVRSVPWSRIGKFELDGALTPKEVDEWVTRASTGEGISDYFSESLEAQRPDKVISWLERNPENLNQMLGLLEDESTPMASRIGVGVVMEQLEGDPRLEQALDTMILLSRSEHANIRADAAHFLGLTHSPKARSTLTNLLKDNHPDVREIAADSLELV